MHYPHITLTRVRAQRWQVRWLAESYTSEEEAHDSLCTLAATVGAVEAARDAIEAQQREKEAQREREQQVSLMGRRVVSAVPWGGYGR